MEFSKKIFTIVIILFIMIITYSMALMWKTDNTDGLAYLIPAISGLAGITVGFYFWKAKAENIVKISQEIGLDKFEETINTIEEGINAIRIESEEN